jgi:hypothetical protein
MSVHFDNEATSGFASYTVGQAEFGVDQGKKLDACLDS